MNRLMIAVSALSLLVGMGAAGVASAQPGYDRDRDHYDRDRYDHDRYEHRGERRDERRFERRDDYARHDWRRGGRIGYDDWRRGRVIDYRVYHLRRPPRGYQWRYVDGNYVLAGIAGGIIADLIAH